MQKSWSAKAAQTQDLAAPASGPAPPADPWNTSASHGMSSPPFSRDRQTDSEPLVDLFNHLLTPPDSSRVFTTTASSHKVSAQRHQENSERPKDNNFCDLVRRHRITVFPSPPKDLVSFCWRSSFYFCMRWHPPHTTTEQEAAVAEVKVCPELITILTPADGIKTLKATGLWEETTTFPHRSPLFCSSCSKGRVTGLRQGGDMRITQGWAEETEAAH